MDEALEEFGQLHGIRKVVGLRQALQPGTCYSFVIRPGEVWQRNDEFEDSDADEDSDGYESDDDSECETDDMDV
jgi:hypothetical protein